MKKLLFVLSTVVILSSLTLSSCGDDDHTSWDGGGENINVLDEITDPEFKTRIKTAMSKGSIKTASPDWLTPQEAAVVERLDSYSWGLTDIKGIEYFTGLTYLDVSKNKISSLDLSRNTKLETLRCNANNLTSLNLNSNTELKKLDCWDNKIESLDLSKCVKLEQLDVNRNNLKTLDVSKNTALTFIDCNECNISGALNVSKNTKLLVLRCSENYTISKINLPPSLTTLYCVLNSLTELELHKCPDLQFVMCTRNPKMPELDISKNRKLKKIQCGNVSTEPQITLYVWWEVPTTGWMWSTVPDGMTVGVGSAGVMKTKK